MANPANSLVRMVIVPSAISILIEAAAAGGGLALWKAVCKVPTSLAPRFRDYDPEYLHNLLDRLETSVTWIILAAASVSCLATIVWFVSGWTSRIDGPGIAWAKRWVWRAIGCGAVVLFAGAMAVMAYFQSLYVKVDPSQLIYQSLAVTGGFAFFYWLASLFGTPVKLRPAVPLASRLPVWLRW